MRLLSACVLPLLLASSAAAAAQDATSDHPCAAMPEPEQRLACYDRAFPPPPAVREAATARAIDTFGLTPAAPARGDPGRALDEAAPSEIEARVTDVDYAGTRRTVTLDNGQRWSLDGGSVGPLATGDVVAIRKAAVGSHRLRTPGGVSLRARRVR